MVVEMVAALVLRGPADAAWLWAVSGLMPELVAVEALRGLHGGSKERARPPCRDGLRSRAVMIADPVLVRAALATWLWTIAALMVRVIAIVACARATLGRGYTAV